MKKFVRPPVRESKERVINAIIAKHGYKSYLEIGYGNGAGFRRIQCQSKLSVDPSIKVKNSQLLKMTSDEFFEGNKEAGATFDMIFIDGLHHADQVRKDIINAMKCLSKNGCIAMHDIHPHNKQMQAVPRKQEQWTGDVWRAWVGFRKKYPDVKTAWHLCDYGLGIIYPEGKKVRAHFEDMETTYEDFNENRIMLL